MLIFFSFRLVRNLLGNGIKDCVVNLHSVISKMQSNQQVAQLDAVNQGLDDSKKQLVAFERELSELRKLAVKVPSQVDKTHMLEIYEIEPDYGFKHCYQGIRAQKRSIARLRPSESRLLVSVNSPNAINAFNRIKDFIIICKVHYNKIYCNEDHNTFISLLNK